MVADPRSWPRPLAAALMSLFAVVAASLPGPVAGGEIGRSGGSTTTWSSSSSGKTVRSETRGAKAGSTYYSNTLSDDGLRDGPAEVDAWSFSRDGGDRRNSSGSQRDCREAEAAIDRTDGDAFWFRRGNDRYLVTDPAVLRELAELFAPQEELGRRQGELGREQGELGRMQGELGRKQGQLGRIQARLGQQQAARPLEREMDEISRQQHEAGELQAELGEQQSALGGRQSALGEQQAMLGREQARVSKQATAALGRLTRELIADGRAERIAP